MHDESHISNVGPCLPKPLWITQIYDILYALKHFIKSTSLERACRVVHSKEISLPLEFMIKDEWRAREENKKYALVCRRMEMEKKNTLVCLIMAV